MSNAFTQEGRIVRNGDVLTLSLAGDAGAMIQLADTFTGTVSFSATADGQNFVPIAGTPIGGGTAVLLATAGGIWVFSVGGLLALQVTGSGWSAGAARVTMRAVEADGGGGGGGGGTALLPTAPLGQMIISQGVGVQPVFSGTAALTGNISAGQFQASFGGFSGPEAGAVVGFVRLSNRLASSAAELVGDLCQISDSTTNVWGATITGGGALNVLGRWNGTAFTVVGK